MDVGSMDQNVHVKSKRPSGKLQDHHKIVSIFLIL